MKILPAEKNLFNQIAPLSVSLTYFLFNEIKQLDQSISSLQPPRLTFSISSLNRYRCKKSLHFRFKVCILWEHCSKFKKKRITWSLSDCSSPCLILTKSPQISGQNKSEACKPEELVKITNGFLRMEIFALAGNSN